MIQLGSYFDLETMDIQTPTATISHSGVEASDSPLADPKATLTQARWVESISTWVMMMMMMMMMMTIMTTIRMTIIKEASEERHDNDADMWPWKKAVLEILQESWNSSILLTRVASHSRTAAKNWGHSGAETTCHTLSGFSVNAWKWHHKQMHLFAVLVWSFPHSFFNAIHWLINKNAENPHQEQGREQPQSQMPNL